ncbi:unnamed protein product [Citrullus colocynthis]|uniref:AP180 N-terminal homology (ANTH) domain-containing protein n=1 Tax=Citrullus colocynthis TaxID=252529 RepID=A0ABP0ZA39_9ROSI
MAQTTIRKAIGAMKDQTAISIAKVAGNMSPELDVLVVKATSHDEDPTDDRVLIDGHPSFGCYAKKVRVLDLSGFREEAHSKSWDHSSFLRFYALYLDELIENLVLENRVKGVDESYYRSRRQSPWRPAGMAKSSRLVITALNLVIKESFGLYIEICDALGVLLDHFKEMEYGDCLRAFDVCANAAKNIDELVEFYAWCKHVGIAGSSEYPEVQMITHNISITLGGFLKEMSRRPKDYNETRMEEEMKPLLVKEPEYDMKEIKTLPPLENCAPVLQSVLRTQSRKEDLVNLREDGVSADEQGNKLALALFSGPPITNPNGSWETFSSNHEPDASSVWQMPVAEFGKPDWELALVETASHLSKQKPDMGGCFDPVLLNGMYDQEMVRRHFNVEQFRGSSSCVAVALQGQGNAAAPDGMVEPIRYRDPFAASLMVPPPLYVQIAEMEKKQQLLMQEQLLWKQYGRDGMQGQVGLGKLGGG